VARRPEAEAQDNSPLRTSSYSLGLFDRYPFDELSSSGWLNIDGVRSLMDMACIWAGKSGDDIDETGRGVSTFMRMWPNVAGSGSKSHSASDRSTCVFLGFVITYTKAS
jgi:hypothetical protein